MAPAETSRASAIRSEYARLAHRYDRRWSAYTQATVRETIRRFELKPGERALDVGCGTGVLLEALARATPGASLAGIDLSREMLAVARARVARTTPLVNADVERLPFAAGVFDVVVSSNAFHFWIDPDASLREIGRVLKPGGRLIVTDWCRDFLACRCSDALLRLVRRISRSSYESRECAALIRAAGFRVERFDTYKINWLWGMMTVAARIDIA